jgi:hypothetical protein
MKKHNNYKKFMRASMLAALGADLQTGVDMTH